MAQFGCIPEVFQSMEVTLMPLKVCALCPQKKMTQGWVVDCEKTPCWAAGGIDPPQPLGKETKAMAHLQHQSGISRTHP
jgi:hypothetical protein